MDLKEQIEDLKSEEIPFSVLVEFFELIALTLPRERLKKGKRNDDDDDEDDEEKKEIRNQTGVIDKFKSWIEELIWPIPDRTGSILFRLIFPEKDIRRKYNLQETKLAQHLVNVFKVSNQKQAERLLKWNQTMINQDGLNVGQDGCLGLEVNKLLQTLFDSREETYALSLSDVDRLLDELAAKSVWSNLKDSKVRKPPRNARLILHDLFDTLSPRQAAYMTQIILKDLRPLLYPLPGLSTNQSLIDFNSRAYDELNQWSMMKAWHWAMPRIYSVKADFDRAADLVEQIPRDLDQVSDKKAVYSLVEKLSELELGIPVDIPKAVKASGTCLASTISKFKGDIWAEVKLDGERMQIHIDRSKSEKDQIQIFSKSHRDSTSERVNTLIPIRAALGLSLIGSSKLMDENPRPSQKPEIHSVKMKVKKKMSRWITQYRSDRQRRHLAVVFFDVLSLNGQSVIDDYWKVHVQVIPNYAMIVDRKKFSNLHDDPVSLNALREYYAEIIAERHEGLMLKADQSRYNDHKPGSSVVQGEERCDFFDWSVDYIKGYGDTADYAILGAGWDRDRARELRVSTATYTAWYVGLCRNLSEVKRKGATPVFEIVFKVLSYGLTRANLDKLNQDAQQVGGFPHKARPSNLPFEYELATGLSAPDIIFKNPDGAYELRWPRIIKAHDLNERGDDEAYQAEIKAWKDRLSRDDEAWNQKRFKKSVATSKSMSEYIPDWLSDTSDEVSDTSECLADVVSMTNPVSSKAHSLRSTTYTILTGQSTCSDRVDATYRLHSRSVKFKLQSDSEQVDDTSSTSVRTEGELKSLTTTHSSRFGPLVNKSLISDGIERTRRSSETSLIHLTRVEQPHEAVSEDDRPLARRTYSKRSLPDQSPSEDPHRNKRRLIECFTDRRKTMDRSLLQDDVEEVQETELQTLRRFGNSRGLITSPSQDSNPRRRSPMKDSNSMRLRFYETSPSTSPTKQWISTRRSPTKDSDSTSTSPTKQWISTRTSPMKESNSTRTSPTKQWISTRTSPMKDSDSTRTSPKKELDSPRISPMKGSSSNCISPTKSSRVARLVKFTSPLPKKSESNSANNVNQLPSVTAPSPAKLKDPSEPETTLVSRPSTLNSSQEPTDGIIVPAAVNLSNYRRPDISRPSSSPLQAITKSPASVNIHRSRYKPTVVSCPTSSSQVTTPSSASTSFNGPEHPTSQLSRPSASPLQAASDSPAQAAIHPSECKTSDVSCSASVPQVPTAIPVPTMIAKSNDSPDLAPRGDTLKGVDPEPDIGTSTSQTERDSRPPWLKGSGVQWCLVNELNDYGISGTRHRSISSLLKSTHPSSHEPEPDPSQVEVHQSKYIFIEEPKAEIIERIRKQICLSTESDQKMKLMVFDMKALKDEGNEDEEVEVEERWKKYKLFDWDSLN
ncbi:ATP dependent DNA ligase domain-containing protein [Melampsora americana]|nr:ATP dependent DNA ligase domain-containing protein [Melampsora americana]